MPGHHLAQVNIARPLEPLTSTRLSGFVAALDEINALADAAPGFVWRLQTEDGDATAIRLLDDDRLIVNMSVWSSMASLTDFVYRSDHVRIMRQRRTWFETMAEAYQALWWVPAGQLATVAEAEQRITHLRAHGPTEYAFTFRDSFASPSSPQPSMPETHSVGEDLTCPA
ncbi:DUF3291 domain-containing protein [Nocardia macrotermitis]|uniref:DUF3291 domain-containing protein n=1 Tax=Nocardia macrotermitis TaxID=2585198 RepID=A0A7K0CXH0_9NOCA|nr:DUF3291 domain-containing protein [Nocardia macrotermitis]MQY17642.1 hypothetical protein [Nocardia macrotermitis]